MERLLNKIEERTKTGQPVQMKLEDESQGEEKEYEVKCSGYRAHLSAHGCLAETKEMIEKIVARRGKRLESIGLTHGNIDAKLSALNFFSEFADSVEVVEVGTSLSVN